MPIAKKTIKSAVISTAVFCAIAISAPLGTSSPTSVTVTEESPAGLSSDLSSVELEQPQANGLELSSGMGTLTALSPGTSLMFVQPWLPIAHLILNWSPDEAGFIEDRVSHLAAISALDTARSTTGTAVHASSIYARPTPSFAELAGNLLLPVEGRILSPYGPSSRPEASTTVRNTGLTFSSEQITEAQAVATGHVVFAGEVDGYGKTIIINHGQSFHSVYGQLSVLHVDQGEMISGGTIIGLTGDLHTDSGSRLYFELRHGGVAFDPFSWLSPGSF